MAGVQHMPSNSVKRVKGGSQIKKKTDRKILVARYTGHRNVKLHTNFRWVKLMTDCADTLMRKIRVLVIFWEMRSIVDEEKKSFLCL